MFTVLFNLTLNCTIVMINNKNNNLDIGAKREYTQRRVAPSSITSCTNVGAANSLIQFI